MKPKLKDIPQIYNLDKVRIYKENLFIGETWIGSSLQMYLEEKFPEYLEATVNELSISVEGCCDDVVVLEIFLK
jgi:hypothetical protein